MFRSILLRRTAVPLVLCLVPLIGRADEAPSSEPIQEVVVTGYGHSLQTASEVKRQAEQVVDSSR
ncbi:hypothetical protein, partial [Azospirillum sp. B4]|uniref:hypothetical protein n=1 Tax=Azospirillum sp. B4 TaxID=95605 RepID=UPI0005C9FE23